VTKPRVEERVQRLHQIASGGEPGCFTRLLAHAQDLASAFVRAHRAPRDRFESLRSVGSVRVTGRAYAWMTDLEIYHPGGDFVKIPNTNTGSLGGNRFFTLRQRQP
jgi:hypothetical protein